MNADLPNELIELLERIVLSNSADYNFRNNKNLQNLLILTAIKADPGRVASYIDRLDNYDGPDLAKICISEQYQLFEEGFLIYKKFQRGVEAINVLLYDLKDISRGAEFAAYWDKPDVWSILGRSQLDCDMVSEAIESFLKADDAQHYQDVIASANKIDAFEDLIKFLQMARSKVRDKAVDSELIYAYAKIRDLAALEKFIGQPHSAILDKVGDRCFEEQLYPAAKIIFSQMNNYAKLASCLVRLEEFQGAVDAARKANSIQTWKDVCYACVDAHKFRLAQMCGVNIIVFMDHLHDLIRHYEIGGHFAELINLLEQGINLDRAHQGIYTQLGILYAKYKEQKLMEHINLFWSRLNIPTLLQACKDNLHWKETVFLYTHYDQYDNACDTMIDHSPVCWEHEQFKQIIVRVSNTEVFYRAINFYLREHPLYLSELLIELSPKLDHKRVVQTIRISSQLPLIQQYLQHVQRDNIQVVNEAANELYVEEENYEALRESIEEYDTFDQIALAQRLQKHQLLEFRRIAAHLYRRNKRWPTSMALSKQDGLWKDAMETAAMSLSPELAEDLLTFFVENTDCPKSCFAACLYTCHEFIRPDIVLELAWRYQLNEFCMPYMVQTLRTFSNRLTHLQNKIEESEVNAENEKKKAEAVKEDQMNAYVNQITNGPLAITGPGSFQPNPAMVGMQANQQYMANNPYSAPQPQVFPSGGANANYQPAGGLFH
jgi:clathrin heavy chain